MIKIYDVAATWHNARGRLNQALGHRNHVLWGALPQAQKDDTMAWVELCLRVRPAGPEELHELWQRQEAMEKTPHPAAAGAYKDLPLLNRVEGRLFLGILEALAPLVDPEELREDA